MKAIQGGLSSMHSKIAHDNRTGAPEGLPPAFVSTVIDYPDRIYGTWWLDGGKRSNKSAGWYIWVESEKILGVTCGNYIKWRIVEDFEEGLAQIANQLW